MKAFPITLAICVAGLFATFRAVGGDFTVGFDTVVCAGGSDTAVRVPFRRPTSFSGTISGAPAVNAGSAVLTVSGSPAFAAGKFTDEAHYLQFTGGGTRSGRVFPVTTHDATSITLDLAGDNLSGVVAGNTFEVVPYWTLGNLFPKDSQITLYVSPNNLSGSRGTEVLFFDGIDLVPDRFYFLTAAGWFLSEPGFPAADDVVIPPGETFVIRHPAGAAATALYTNQVVVEGSRTEVPDATIGKSRSSQKGDGTYNRTGSRQKLKRVSKNRKKLKFFFKVQNDSDFPDTISVTATPKDKFFKAKYFRISGSRTNVTAALKRDAYQARIVGKAEETFQLDVKPTRRAGRRKKSFAIDAKSLGDARDRVKAEAKAK